MEIHKTSGLQLPHTAPIKFWLVYIISVVFTFFSLFTAFSSSTYMERFVAPEQVGLLYSAGALLGIVLFFLMPYILRQNGNVVTTLILMSISIVTLLFIGIAPSTLFVVLAFILFLGITPLIYLNIDIFSETLIGTNEGKTGSTRGLALTLMSMAGLAAPFAMGTVIGDTDNLALIYFLAIGVGLVFITIIIGAFRQFYDPIYHRIKIKDLIRLTYNNRNIRVVLFTHFLLQLFFTWMVIYVPLYLATEVGLSWVEISQIIAAGFVAYVIFEYPIGIIADDYIGEKEMMAVGFLILALSSAAISFTAMFGLWGWMLVIFISRVGASLVEVTTESYFFKQVNGNDSGTMSLFRLMRPLANFAGALLGTVTLLILPLQLMFIVLGFVMVGGMIATLVITDSR